jgi:uncharacterized protein YneF (UPF0154 family)
VNEVLAYIFLALDLIVGAAIIYGFVAGLWWISRRALRSARPSEQKPPA